MGGGGGGNRLTKQQAVEFPQVLDVDSVISLIVDTLVLLRKHHSSRGSV